MTILFKTLHRDLCKKFGGSNIGMLSQMHPMVQRIFTECSPQAYGSSKYEEFVAAICDWDKDIEREDVRHWVPPDVFADHMHSFATGLQYAAKKLGAKVQIDDYKFEHTLHGIEGGQYKDFIAGASRMSDGTTQLVINPAVIYLVQLKPKEMSEIRELIGYKGFTHHELEIVTGAEEFLHFYQRQHNDLKPTYSIDHFDRKAYKNDQMEIEGDAFKKIVIEELGLGPQFRGQRK